VTFTTPIGWANNQVTAAAGNVAITYTNGSTIVTTSVENQSVNILSANDLTTGGLQANLAITKLLGANANIITTTQAAGTYTYTINLGGFPLLADGGNTPVTSIVITFSVE